MYYAADTLIFSNGDFLKASEARVDPFSQTLHYGNGVFDGLRAYQTDHGPRIFKARAHYERFAEAAQVMALPLEYSVDELIEISYELLKRNELSDAYIRPLLVAAPNMSLTSTTHDAHLIISAFQWGKLLGDNLVNLKISAYRRPSSSAFPIEGKICGLYVNNILVTSEARRDGFHEGLMLDEEGHVAQAAGANLFIEKDEVLITPPQGNIMPGITRKTVMDMAQEMGIPVIERPLSIEEVCQADGAFLAGTAVEITGVATIDRYPMQHHWNDTIGHLLSRKYRQKATHGEPFKWTLI
jgi:branched-chain amino acid aminotransferase